MIQIEIDLYELHKAQAEGGRPGLVKKKVTVKRGGKTFEQYRWVKSGVEEPEEKKPVKEPVAKPEKELVIMGLNKPEPEPEPEEKETEKVKDEIDTKDLSERMGFYQSGLKFHPDGEKIIDSVSEYTAIDYSGVNDYLRTEQSGNKEKDGQINDISTFLKNAPKMEGEVYRGMNFLKSKKDSLNNFNDFLSNVEEGKSLMLKSFTSTSTKKDVAMEFADPGNAHMIVFEIKSKSGVYLDGVSQKEEENEVLFDKNSKFNVLKVDKSKHPDHVRIVMEEI